MLHPGGMISPSELEKHEQSCYYCIRRSRKVCTSHGPLRILLIRTLLIECIEGHAQLCSRWKLEQDGRGPIHHDEGSWYNVIRLHHLLASLLPAAASERRRTARRRTSFFFLFSYWLLVVPAHHAGQTDRRRRSGDNLEAETLLGKKGSSRALPLLPSRPVLRRRSGDNLEAENLLGKRGSSRALPLLPRGNNLRSIGGQAIT